MKLLEDRILKDGKALEPDILKVDSFINHQIDVELIDEMGKEIHRLFSDCDIDRIITIEASGIPIACAAAKYFRVPVVFAKKGARRNVNDDNYSAECFSYTHNSGYTMYISKKYLHAGEKVLIVDDFLAGGNASLALKKIIDEAGAEISGIAIAIEKGFQEGGKKLREMGLRVSSLAIVDSMENGVITFRENND